MNTTTKRTLNNAEIEKAAITLAEISAASVLKNLVTKSSQETMFILKRELQIDKGTIKRAEYIGDKTTALERRNEEIKKELTELAKVLSILKGRLSERENSSFMALYKGTKTEIESLKAERKRISEEKDILYKKLGESLRNGNDLINTAVCAIYENFDKVKEYFNDKFYDIPTDEKPKEKFFADIVQEMGNIVIDREYKTIREQYTGVSKQGNISKFYKAKRDENGEIVKAWQDITLRYATAKAVNQYINQYRSMTALQTCYIITGYDEDGNELLLQNSAFETLGGVDSVEEKIDFNILFKKCESVLTARQIEIIKLILKGLSQKEISEKLGVSENTIYSHTNQIREKMKNIGVSLKK